MALARLGDFQNACAAYQKAATLAPDDHVIRLNFAISLYNEGPAHDGRAREELGHFDRLLGNIEKAAAGAPVEHDSEVLSQSRLLRTALGW